MSQQPSPRHPAALVAAGWLLAALIAVGLVLDLCAGPVSPDQAPTLTPTVPTAPVATDVALPVVTTTPLGPRPTATLWSPPTITAVVIVGVPSLQPTATSEATRTPLPATATATVRPTPPASEYSTRTPVPTVFKPPAPIQIPRRNP